MNRSKTMAAGLLLAVFVAGLAVGGGATALTDFENGESRPEEERGERRSYVERLQERLGLTDEQAASVGNILEGRRDAFHTLSEDLRPQYDAIRTAARQDILAQLDDEQRQALEEMIRHSDSVRAARAHRNERGGRGDSDRRRR